jgi:glycosyltransferase involved in cell wall biosynthesis
VQDELEIAVRGQLTILHVSQPTDGGVAGYVADAVADQARRGWRVIVASPAHGNLGKLIEAAGAEHLKWTAGRAPGPSSLIDATRLSRIVARENPDLVHLHSSKAGLAGRLAVRGRRPTIFQPHAWSFEAVRGPVRAGALAWERRAAAWAAAILCVSETERARGEEHGVRANWRVIPNGVDLEAWTEASGEERSAARRRLELDERPTVVCVGRLCRQKGQDILLDAWPAIVGSVPEAQLVLVGDGPDEKSLRRRAGEGVLLVGARVDVGDWLAAADIAAVPSRWEGMSIGMLEAMARGRSVVASDVPGAHEAVGREAGAVVPSGDAVALANAIVTRLRDPAQAAAEGRAARESAERSHDLRATTAALVELYEELLSPSVLDSAPSSSTGRTTP